MNNFYMLFTLFLWASWYQKHPHLERQEIKDYLTLLEALHKTIKMSQELRSPWYQHWLGKYALHLLGREIHDAQMILDLGVTEVTAVICEP